MTADFATVVWAGPAAGVAMGGAMARGDRAVAPDEEGSAGRPLRLLWEMYGPALAVNLE
ncbi:MAG TPA: hypothetical protein VMD51_11380 [Mycobacterium sp.]|nr:hypothetical protein [Mycobacterium sp.]